MRKIIGMMLVLMLAIFVAGCSSTLQPTQPVTTQPVVQQAPPQVAPSAPPAATVAQAPSTPAPTSASVDVASLDNTSDSDIVGNPAPMNDVGDPSALGSAPVDATQ